MTGQGQAQGGSDDLSVWAEVRAVNNRYLKVSLSCADRYSELESQVKSLVQEKMRRGSVYIQLEIQRSDNQVRYRINKQLLLYYHEQLTDIDPNTRIAQLIELPGVVEEISHDRESHESPWPFIEPVLAQALDRLVEMRRSEGESMARDLLTNCAQMQQQLAEIRQRAPRVASDYSNRLSDRINQLLAEHEVSVSPSDLVREVGIFADKCDISEETVRLQTHIDQFSNVVNSGQSDGRKLEFLSQEMLRETNTIGSKANDSQIAKNVVEIKTAIERIREMTQNIE